MIKLIKEAFSNLFLHKIRTLLAALGIIFGVASIICMLSISEIARKDVVERIKRMGVENIIIDSVEPESVSSKRAQAAEADERTFSTYGLTRKNVRTITESLTDIDSATVMRVFTRSVKSASEYSKMSIVATDHNYSTIMSHEVKYGRFITPVDSFSKSSICVLGSEAARRLFPISSPVGEQIKIGDQYFTIVGVMAEKGRTGDSGNLAKPDNVVYLPIDSSYARFGRSSMENSFEAQVEVNRVVIKAKPNTSLKNIAKACKNYLVLNHKQEDIAITIPSSLLKERQQAEKIFKWVMGSLASISLLVGGIGITNIMLANMSERRSEIGLRRALGATKSNIIRLFLLESIVLCVISGIAGVAMGVGLAHTVGSLANWSVQIVPLSIPLGIGVSTLTGLISGTFPAIKAANYDPVQALRMD